MSEGPVTDVSTFLPDEADERRRVTGEVSAEIAGAVGPLEATIPQIEQDREAAAATLAELFGGAIADASASANKMRGDYNQAIASETSIHAEARDRLNQLRQQRAADAQKLSQQIGGPVPLGEFTDPADLEASLFSSESAGSLLRATGLAEAGVQHAEAFSGRVLPLLRTQEISATRASFNKEISRIRNEIASIKGQKSGLINERTRQRMLEEREFALKRATSNRDWELAKKSAQLDRDTLAYNKKAEAARLKETKIARKRDEIMANKSLNLEERRIALAATETYGGEVKWNPKTKKYEPVKGGKPTQAAKEFTAAQKQAGTEAKAERRAYAYELVEAYMNPGVEDVSGTQFVPVAGPDAPGAFFDGTQWVRAITVKQQIGRDPVDNPNVLWQLLQGQGIPKKLAQEVVAKRFPDWVPGKAAGKPTETTAQERGEVSPRDTTTYTKEQLSTLSAAALIKIARKAGFEHPAPPGIQLWPPSYKKKLETDKNAKRTPEEKKEYTKRLRDYWRLQILTRQAKRAGTIPGKGERG